MKQPTKKELIQKINDLQKIVDQGKSGFITESNKQSVTERNFNLSDSLLQEEIASRKESESILQTESWKLRERLKELRCMMEVGRWINEKVSLDEIFKRLTKLIPESWQYPEITAVRIEYQGKSYKSENFRESKWSQKQDIVVENEVVGSIDVVYLEKKKDFYEGPFLKEERNLIDAIANNISGYIELIDAENELEEHFDQLQKIWDSTPEILYVSDPNTYEVLFANKHIEKLLGQTPIGKKCYNIFHGYDEPCSFCTNDIILKNKGKPYTWEHYNEILEKYYKITDQIIKWSDGRDVRFEIATDITGQKKTEEQLQVEIEEKASIEEELRSTNEQLQDEVHERAAVEEELRATNERLLEEMHLRQESEKLQEVLINAPNETIAMIKKDGEIIQINTVGAKRFGKKAHQLIGENLYALMPKELAQKRRKLINSVFTSGKHIMFKDSRSVWHFENRIYPVFGARGKVEYAAIYANDISERLKAENALQESQQFIESILNISPDFIFVFDLKYNKYIYRNDGAFKLMGYNKQEIKKFGDKILESLMHPEDLKIYLKDIFPKYLKLKDKDVIDHTYRIKHRNGEYVLLRSKELIFKRDKKGKAIQLMGILEDITQQQKMKDALMDSEERMRTVFDSLRDALFIIDKKGLIKNVNKAVTRMYGYTKEEIIGMPTTKCIRKDYHPVFKKFVHDIKKEGHFTGETIDVRKGGAEFHTEVIGASLLYGGEEHYMAIVRDITSRKKAQDKIKESEQKFHSLYDNSPDMYASVSPVDASIIECNNTLLRETGYSREEVIGLPVFRIYHEESIHKAKFVFEELIKEGRIANRELILKKKNGEKIDVSLNVESVRDKNGEIVYSMSSWRDITEKKRQEILLRKTLDELERSNRELEQFAYIASHDLQEPLRMVSSFLQLLQNRYTDVLDKDGLEFIDYAVDGATRMRQLIKDLLSFSRVGTRGKPFESARINELVNLAIKNLSESITESNAKIEVKKLPVLDVDGTQIVQLFQNLISNSIKFKSDKEPVIKISAKRTKGTYEFLVEDNGIGFDKQYSERIFTIFQRLHTSEEYSGTGIGLAVCKKIVERHGGRIWVDSSLGKGTKFYFTLKRDE